MAQVDSFVTITNNYNGPEYKLFDIKNFYNVSNKLKINYIKLTHPNISLQGNTLIEQIEAIDKSILSKNVWDYLMAVEEYFKNLYETYIRFIIFRDFTNEVYPYIAQLYNKFLPGYKQIFDDFDQEIYKVNSHDSFVNIVNIIQDRLNTLISDNFSIFIIIFNIIQYLDNFRANFAQKINNDTECLYYYGENLLKIKINKLYLQDKLLVDNLSETKLDFTRKTVSDPGCNLDINNLHTIQWIQRLPILLKEMLKKINNYNQISKLISDRLNTTFEHIKLLVETLNKCKTIFEDQYNSMVVGESYIAYMQKTITDEKLKESIKTKLQKNITKTEQLAKFNYIYDLNNKISCLHHAFISLKHDPTNSPLKLDEDDFKKLLNTLLAINHKIYKSLIINKNFSKQIETIETKSGFEVLKPDYFKLSEQNVTNQLNNLKKKNTVKQQRKNALKRFTKVVTFGVRGKETKRGLLPVPTEYNSSDEGEEAPIYADPAELNIESSAVEEEDGTKVVYAKVNKYRQRPTPPTPPVLPTRRYNPLAIPTTEKGEKGEEEEEEEEEEHYARINNSAGVIGGESVIPSAPLEQPQIQLPPQKYDYKSKFGKVEAPKILTHKDFGYLTIDFADIIKTVNEKIGKIKHDAIQNVGLGQTSTTSSTA
jgi:hypothetical protein